MLTHLYIGKAGGDTTGFTKLTMPGSQLDGIIYTHAFISKEDADAYYGEGNHTRVSIIPNKPDYDNKP